MLHTKIVKSEKKKTANGRYGKGSLSLQDAMVQKLTSFMSNIILYCLPRAFLGSVSTYDKILKSFNIIDKQK